ncbi:hypothetical protein MKW92_004760 [Papaver armeniacum]|nr:hypothetical protein MKW92_004760 [Papaver armeniacum]
MKKRKKKLEEEEDNDDEHEFGLGNLNDDIIFEVLKHLDVKTLATAACVNKKWSKMAEDDELWEFICTRRWADMGLSNRKFRSFVLDFGGFRRFYSSIISALLEKKTSSSSPTIASSRTSTIFSKKQTFFASSSVASSSSRTNSVLTKSYFQCMYFVFVVMK